MDPAGNRAGDALDLKASAAEADRDVWCLTLEPSRLCVEVGMLSFEDVPSLVCGRRNLDLAGATARLPSILRCRFMKDLDFTVVELLKKSSPSSAADVCRLSAFCSLNLLSRARLSPYAANLALNGNLEAVSCSSSCTISKISRWAR